MKVVVCGPPHSGKSVLTALLTSRLPRESHMVVEGAPDGEGVTGWAHAADAALVKQVRQKGTFDSKFVDFVVRSITTNLTVPLTLVDVGGRRSPQNERIFKSCDGFIVVSSDAGETAQWIAFGKSLGLELIAVLHSTLDGEDALLDAGYPLQLRVARLVREDPPHGSLAISLVANRLMELVLQQQSTNSTDGSEIADVVFPRLAPELGLPLLNGGPGYDWVPSVLPRLIQMISVRVEMEKQAEVKLWGNVSAGFPYHALACFLRKQRVRYFDPKVGNSGYVPLPELMLREKMARNLIWQREEAFQYTFVEFKIPGQVFDVFDLPEVTPPVVPNGKGVILSGKGPWWLTGAIGRAYARQASWVAIFAPRESGRSIEGMKWSQLYPGMAPAIVIASRDPQNEIGTVVPFTLLHTRP